MIRAEAIKDKIEEVVNGPEVVRFAEDQRPFEELWSDLLHLIERRVEEDIFPDDQGKLYKDLRDWWKNGNLGSDGYWAFGEWPWWTDDTSSS